MPWRKCFPIHEIGRIDGGRGFQTRKNVFRIGGNTFCDWKNKIPMKILESKRSEIGKIAEFRGIPNGFPNLVLRGPAPILRKKGLHARQPLTWRNRRLPSPTRINLEEP
jgi:hypothetical protein